MSKIVLPCGMVEASAWVMFSAAATVAAFFTCMSHVCQIKKALKRNRIIPWPLEPAPPPYPAPLCKSRSAQAKLVIDKLSLDGDSSSHYSPLKSPLQLFSSPWMAEPKRGISENAHLDCLVPSGPCLGLRILENQMQNQVGTTIFRGLYK